MDKVEIKPAGDCALTVEFENKIDISVNLKVHSLVRALEEKPITGVIEMVPSYRAVMVYYQPELIRYGKLTSIIEKRLADCKVSAQERREIIELPALYGGEYGMDIEDVAAHENVSVEDVIRMHSDPLAFVYAVGFAPGLAYIGSSTPTFTIPRLKTPRVKVARDCFGVWESQTTTIPFDQPCGWSIIGRAAIHFYDGRRKQPSYFKAGQWVRFVPVEEKDYLRIRQMADDGTYEAKVYMEG